MPSALSGGFSVILQWQPLKILVNDERSALPFLASTTTSLCVKLAVNGLSKELKLYGTCFILKRSGLCCKAKRKSVSLAYAENSGATLYACVRKQAGSRRVRSNGRECGWAYLCRIQTACCVPGYCVNGAMQAKHAWFIREMASLE